MAVLLAVTFTGCLEDGASDGLEPRVPERPSMGNVTTPTADPVDVPISVLLEAPEDARRISFDSGTALEVSFDVANGGQAYFVVVDGEGASVWSAHEGKHTFTVDEATGPWTVWARGTDDGLLLVDGARGTVEPIAPVVTSERYQTTLVGGERPVPMEDGCIFVELDAQVGTHRIKDSSGRVVAAWPDAPQGLVGQATSLTLESDVGAVGDVIVTQTALA